MRSQQISSQCHFSLLYNKQDTKEMYIYICVCVCVCVCFFLLVDFFIVSNSNVFYFIKLAFLNFSMN